MIKGEIVQNPDEWKSEIVRELKRELKKDIFGRILIIRSGDWSRWHMSGDVEVMSDGSIRIGHKADEKERI